jgi:hypothetical protein
MIALAPCLCAIAFGLYCLLAPVRCPHCHSANTTAHDLTHVRCCDCGKGWVMA